MVRGGLSTGRKMMVKPAVEKVCPDCEREIVIGHPICQGD